MHSYSNACTNRAELACLLLSGRRGPVGLPCCVGGAAALQEGAAAEQAGQHAHACVVVVYEGVLYRGLHLRGGYSLVRHMHCPHYLVPCIQSFHIKGSAALTICSSI